MRENIITGLIEYRKMLWSLMQKSHDPDKINLLGIRYESSARVINELLKAIFDETNVGKLEAEIV